MAALTPAEQQVVAKVQHALDSIRTLKSRFVQSSTNGAKAEGTLYLSRPGQLRINYAPPQHMQIVVKGDWLIQADTRLRTLTYVGLSRTPADILVSDKVDLGGRVKVLGVERGDGTIRVGMVRRGAEDQGSLVLVMDAKTMALRQWIVTDQQGVGTRVALVDPQVNVPLDPQVFAFDTSEYDKNAIQ